MFDDDSELDQELSRTLKAYGDRAAEDHPSLWPRVQNGLRRSGQRRTRRIPRRWLLPVILLPLLASAGTALAVYSHTSPIVWIFQPASKSGLGQTNHAYIPSPERVSLARGSSLLKTPLVLLRGEPNAHLQSVTFQGATTADRAKVAPSDQGSVVLVYRINRKTISLREYHSSVGPLVTKLRGSVSSGTGSHRQALSVITVSGSTYQVDIGVGDQVNFTEWKTVRGVLVVLNSLAPRTLPLQYLRQLLPHLR